MNNEEDRLGLIKISYIIKHLEGTYRLLPAPCLFVTISLSINPFILSSLLTLKVNAQPDNPKEHIYSEFLQPQNIFF